MMIERIFAVILFFLLFPILLIIVCCIVIEGIFNTRAWGSVFYHEKRYSKGKLFTMYKFRTFYPVAITQKTKKGGFSSFEKKPENITNMGRLLRRYYLDELPQIINVIKGNMRFVGPRPLAEEYYQLHINHGNISKKELFAGWTGPWQSEKGHILSLEDMIRVENEYYYRINKLNGFQKIFYNSGIVLRTFKIIAEGKSI